MSDVPCLGEDDGEEVNEGHNKCEDEVIFDCFTSLAILVLRRIVFDGPKLAFSAAIVLMK